jgi:hypothetical protein
MIISRSVLLRIRNVSDRVVEKIKTHILCSITYFRKSCRLWDNVEKYGTARQTTDDNIIRRMRFACWITKATDTHTHTHTHTQNMKYSTYCFSMATMVTRTRLNVTFIRNVTCYRGNLWCRMLTAGNWPVLKCNENSVLLIPMLMHSDLTEKQPNSPTLWLGK